MVEAREENMPGMSEGLTKADEGTNVMARHSNIV